MLMQVKKTPSFRIIRDSKNLTEMVKATIWYILKKSECTGNLSNTKRPSWRTTLHHLTKSKTLSRRFCITVKAYNQETCSWMEIQGFTTRCKASFTFQNRKIRLDFAKKPLKGPALCWKKKSLDQMKTRWTCMVMVGREKCGEGEKGLMIQNMPHCLSAHYVQKQQRLSPGEEIR